MTVGCATCHDHKFDPISQKDFYSLGAFFRNTTQKVMDDNIPDTPPVVRGARGRRPRPLAGHFHASGGDPRGDDGGRVPRPASPSRAGWRERSRDGSAHPLDATDELFAADIRALAMGAGDQHLGESNIEGRPALIFAKNDGVSIARAPKLDAEKPFSISVGFFFPKAEQIAT